MGVQASCSGRRRRAHAPRGRACAIVSGDALQGPRGGNLSQPARREPGPSWPMAGAVATGSPSGRRHPQSVHATGGGHADELPQPRGTGGAAADPIRDTGWQPRGPPRRDLRLVPPRDVTDEDPVARHLPRRGRDPRSQCCAWGAAHRVTRGTRASDGPARTAGRRHPLRLAARARFTAHAVALIFAGASRDSGPWGRSDGWGEHPVLDCACLTKGAVAAAPRAVAARVTPRDGF